MVLGGGVCSENPHYLSSPGRESTGQRSPSFDRTSLLEVRVILGGQIFFSALAAAESREREEKNSETCDGSSLRVLLFCSTSCSTSCPL